MPPSCEDDSSHNNATTTSYSNGHGEPHRRSPSTDTTSSDATVISPTSYPKAKVLQEKRGPRKKALLIGIKYTRNGMNELVGPHKDVQDMRETLIKRFGYEERNITMLIDNDDPNQIQPTHQNMVSKIKELVSEAQAGDTFVFHYAGHSTQVENRDNSEEDGMDECLVPLDGSQTSGHLIKDNDLHRYLVKDLPPGCALVAIFDTCHSASLLDLEHYRCNRVYTPWVSKGKRRSASRWNQNVRRLAQAICSNCTRSSPIAERNVHSHRTFAGLIHSNNAQLRRSSIEQVMSSGENPQVLTRATLPLSISTDVERPSIFLSSPGRYTMTPEPIWPCDGFCRTREDIAPDGRLVVSLSAAKDEQRSWEDRDGASMTQALIRLLNEDTTPTFRKLLVRVSHDLHRSYIKLHDEARTYKKVYKARADQAKRSNRPVVDPHEVEMDNFQDPQLSSLFPLDMEDKLRL